MCVRTAYKFLVTNKRLEKSSLFRIANKKGCKLNLHHLPLFYLL